MNRVLAAFAVALLSATAADAACTQSQLTGTWHIYFHASSVISYRCTAAVKASGAMAGSCTSMANDVASQLKRGSKLLMTTPSDCTLTGSILYDDKEHSIDHVTLARDGLSAAGVAGYNGSSPVPVSMVKR